MSTNNFFRSDLQRLHHIVQSSMIVYPKEVIIATLKDFFAKDSYYHYQKDAWGFANTTDHTDLPLGADLPRGPGARPDLSLTKDLSTRLFIGENWRFDVIHYPAILVKNGGSRYVPISINRDQTTVQYEDVLFQDGYGHSLIVKQPKYFVTSGAWEGSIIIDVLTRSARARDDLIELIGMCFTEIYFDSLYDVGLICKPMQIGAPMETDDRHDKLYRQSITIDIRSEWRRMIPIGNVIERVLFSVEFGNLSTEPNIIAPNLTIQTELDLVDNFP